MTRLIITFETVFQVLAANKLLKDRVDVRSVPTPAKLSSSVCGISIELLQPAQKRDALDQLKKDGLNPTGVYELESIF